MIFTCGGFILIFGKSNTVMLSLKIKFKKKKKKKCQLKKNIFYKLSVINLNL